MKNLLFLLAFMGTATLYAQDCQCCSENHKSFDFWLGTWTVKDAQGATLGHNTIDKVNENCIVREVYTNPDGTYVGSSNSFYHKQLEQWEQVWVYADGRTLYLTGNRKGDTMILSSNKTKNAAGVEEQDIITWTDHKNGTVTQKWERTYDDMTTVVFEGTYEKKN